MRLGLLLIGLGVLCAGCDPNAGKLFADVQLATRCEVTRGCPGPVDRDVCGIHQGDACDPGQPEAELTCNVEELEDGERILGFSVSQGSFAFAVSQAEFPSGGGSATGSNCQVRVSDGGNTYAGRCGGGPPSPAQPCRVNEVMFFDDAGNPTVSGEIFCQFLPNRATDTLQIEVSRIGPTPADEAASGRFRFVNCDGLEL